MDRVSKSIRSVTPFLILAILGIHSIVQAMAYEREEDFTRLMPVSEEALGEMRGGFQREPNGPVLSFGIERSVFLNGKLINSTVLNIPDLSKLTADSSHTLTLVQNGRGNTVPADLSALPTLMTVLQNSRDNQTLQTQTVINATATALSLSRALALGTALSQATLGTIRH
ncbi:MAG: hypothetical protein OJF47_001805 [Nitrospira sp.]|jgi:hypothetical protein|nr:MAG: hypothetical protein OJF47_001805 [Nitrospira sp.]